jgi:hypothetical protein
MGTSEKRPDLAMGRRPIDIFEESALVPIEEFDFYFRFVNPRIPNTHTVAVFATHDASARCALNA